MIHRRLCHSGGFTLVEVLVVVVIAAVVASMVVVSWSSDPVGDELKKLSDDLAFRLAYGFDEASLHAADFGLLVYEDGYEWARWLSAAERQAEQEAGQTEDGSASDEPLEGEWVLMEPRRPWGPVTFDEDYQLQAQSGQPLVAVVLKPRPTGSDRKKDDASLTDSAMIVPMMAHGETFATVFTIEHRPSGRLFEVTLSEFGQVSIRDEHED